MTREAPSSPVELFGAFTDNGTPLYRQLYQEIRDAILSGRLPPGMVLPPSRVLASQLGIGRTTVVNTYEILVSEGYLTGTERAGTYVADILPGVLPLAGARGRTDLPERGVVQPARARPEWASTAYFGPAVPLNANQIAVDHFPLKTWSKLAARRMRRLEAEMLRPGDPLGYRPLREAIAAYVRASRAVTCEPDQIVVVAGVQLALNLLARLLLAPGDAVWIENPGDFRVTAGFIQAGATVVPVPVDAEGLDVDAGIAREPLTRLVHVMPSSQDPLGVTLSLSRRLRLIEWAHRASAWIVEEEADGALRYRGRPQPSLQGLDRHRRTIYLGEFTRLLFPSLRIAYLVMPEALVGPVLETRHFFDIQPPVFEQLILADFIAEGHLARHIRRICALYAERQNALFESGAEYLAGLLELEPRDAGLCMVGWLPDEIREEDAVRQAAARGVIVGNLGAEYIEPSARQRAGLTLGFAAYTPKQIREAVGKLALALEAARSG
jgi:GntR family transcriptional regulator/MocR family aminotransferase